MEKTLSDFLEFTPPSARTFCQNMQAAVTGISPFHVGMSADDIRVDIIYYIDANISLPNHITKGNYIICTSDYSSMNKFESPSNIIYISDEDEYLAFIHKISTILADENRLSHISARILSMLQNGYSVQKILEYGFELLGNPLMVSDASFCYIAGVHLDDIDEPVWNYVAEKKVFPDSYISNILMRFLNEPREKRYRSLFIDGPKDAPKGGLEHIQYSATIIHNNQIIGYAKLLHYFKEPSEFDTQVLLLLSDYLGIVLQQDANGSLYDSPQDSFLASVLNRRITDVTEIRQKRAVFNFKLFDNLRVITVFPIDDELISERKFYILRELKSFFIGFSIIAIDNHFVILYDRKDKGPLPPDFVSKFRSLLEDNNCKACISMQFQNFEEIYKYYEQTLFCNETKDFVENDDTTISYDEIFFLHMIKHYGELVDINDLIHPAISKLIKFDTENNTNLATTLEYYLKNQEFSISLTAKDMNVHYNTLKNRIEKIQEITRLDLKDQEDVFRLTLSYFFLKYLKSK